MTVAPVLAPFSSTSAIGALLTAPVASFQCVLLTTPAASLGARGVPVPTKSMLTAAGVEPGEGTIWIPLTGARAVLMVVEPGVAVKVKLVPWTVNLR